MKSLSSVVLWLIVCPAPQGAGGLKCAGIDRLADAGSPAPQGAGGLKLARRVLLEDAQCPAPQGAGGLKL